VESRSDQTIGPMPEERPAGSQTKTLKQPRRRNSPQTIDADSCARSPARQCRYHRGIMDPRFVELLLDTRAASPLPVGSQAGTASRFISEEPWRNRVTTGARSLNRLLLYLWASPTTMVGALAGVLTLCTGGRFQVERGAVEFYGGFSRWLAKRFGFSAMTL